MRLGAVLAAEPARHYQPIGIHGQPVADSHIQLKAAVSQRFGARHAAIFSRPDQDARDESIRWVSEAFGTARRWSELSPEEQTRTAMALEEIRADLAGYANEIRSSSHDPSALSFAALIESAVAIPSFEHIHLVGDQPVLSFWGFRSANGDVVTRFVLPSGAVAGQAASGPATLAAQLAATSPWWRRWLLPLLLLLALLLAWLLLARSCTVPIELPAVPLPSNPQASPAAPDAVTLTPPQTGPAGTLTLPSAPAGEGSGPAVNDLPAVVDPQAADPTSPPPAPPDPAQDTPNTPPVPSTPAPEAAPATVPPPPSPDAPPGEAMQIPPDAAAEGNVAFLEGLWRSQRGLIDNSTGEALTQYYRFGADGQGETIIRRADGSECKAPAVGSFRNGQLVLEEQGNLTCPDGRTYDQSHIQCGRTASGLTSCDGINPDGSHYRVGLENPQ
ncbi:hypothetical protein [Radicibacter daui]|uniref:hypothetical protein n=1 Tax=Radicibacter daui TaxID=3064829 RepID=UPI004046A4F0